MVLTERERLVHCISTLSTIGTCFDMEHERIDEMIESFRKQRCHSTSPTQTLDVMNDIIDEICVQEGNDIMALMDDLRTLVGKEYLARFGWKFTLALKDWMSPETQRCMSPISGQRCMN